MTKIIDWTKYPNFSEDELRCKHTGLCSMNADFMAILQQIRTEYGKPMVITSGYRHSTHPQETKKAAPGEHSYGCAVDVAIRGEEAMRLLKIALNHGITRVGVRQKGEGRFMHFGIGAPNLPTPMIWSY